MNVLAMDQLERLVRDAFPARQRFRAAADLGLDARRLPLVTFVHGGPDPFLDRALDAWLEGAGTFVQLYALLNRLCRSGALPPGEYAITNGAR